ncbi:hypothetical protein I6F35_33515 [Bradyrhizobium sp. BRP22]|uniref:hypothetical protein n=1 Tax=Bradyrhizobium sp. BRP22 TaxID=2793821 RepID=UPI001CD6E7F7|nr:hypothetical protein [Bradyrhizobium sp. BRP22]MCA1458054.1 hypothetical protein [Bradyrhizobium sp. BRP22]
MSGNAGASIGHAPGPASTPQEEMAAFEQLGPACKAALNDSVFPWSSVEVARRFKLKNLDPSDPDHDTSIANELRAIDATKAADRRV